MCTAFKAYSTYSSPHTNIEMQANINYSMRKIMDTYKNEMLTVSKTNSKFYSHDSRQSNKQIKWH